MTGRLTAAALFLFASAGAASAQPPPVSSSGASGHDLQQIERGRRLNIRFRSTASGNLTWQLDTLAGRTNTLPKDYEDLWRKQLGWTADDDRQLAKWKAHAERYRRQPSGGAGAPASRYPANYGRFYASLNADYRFRIAGLDAPPDGPDLRGLDRAYRKLCGSECAAEAAAVLAHFRPRFLAWWNGQDAASGRRLLESIRAQAAARGMAGYFEQIAAVTQARVPGGHTISLHVVVHPKDFLTNMSATVMDNHLLMEVVDDAEVGGVRLGTFAHELTHHFYDFAPRRAHLRMIDRFLARPEPYSMAAYSILNEALASAAQVLWEQRILPPADFETFLAKDENIYFDPFISKAGRALAPILAAWMQQGRTIHEEAFVDEYLRATGTALGPVLSASPRFLLSTRALIHGPSGKAARDHFKAAVRGINSQDEWADLARAPSLGGVVFVTPEDRALLLAHGGVLTAADADAVLTRMDQAPSQPFAYSVARTPKASLYILYAPGADPLLALSKQFAASDTPFLGLRRF